MISPHHFHPTNGVRPSDVNDSYFYGSHVFSTPFDTVNCTLTLIKPTIKIGHDDCQIRTLMIYFDM
jgi:hypothetical protein